MSALIQDLPPAISPEAEQSLLLLGRRDDIVLAAIRPAFQYCKRLSRGRLPDDELLSATYSALAKAIKNFKPGQQRFVSYARAYCRGELAAAWRDRDVVKSASKHETEIPKDAIPQPLSDDFCEPEDGHYKEIWAHVEQHIRALPKKERQALELRFKFFMTYQKAGEYMGLSRERVRQLEASALRKLRAVLPKGLNQ